VFDYQKLEWYNGQYIRQKSDEELAGLVRPFLVEAGLRAQVDAFADERDRSAMPLVRERLKLLSDAPAIMTYLYGKPTMPPEADFIPKKLDREKTIAMLEENLSLMAGTDFSVIEAAEERFRARAIEIGAKLGDMLMPLRVAITGSRVSPPLFESIRLLGNEECDDRIRSAIAYLRSCGE